MHFWTLEICRTSDQVFESMVLVKLCASHEQWLCDIMTPVMMQVRGRLSLPLRKFYILLGSKNARDVFLECVSTLTHKKSYQGSIPIGQHDHLHGGPSCWHHASHSLFSNITHDWVLLRVSHNWHHSGGKLPLLVGPSRLQQMGTLDIVDIMSGGVGQSWGRSVYILCLCI